MTQILILTNSADGTCDVLAGLFKSRNLSFFRWNIDLWQHYEISFSERSITIADPTGRVVDISNPELFLLWRKPFAEQMSFDGQPFGVDDQSMARAQIVKWMQSVVATMLFENRVRLVEPYADQRLPKLFQLQHAVDFFAVPKSLFSINKNPDSFGPSMVTKPLGNPSVGEKSIFYTRLVDGRDLLRPYPWFVQEALVGGSDITCVYINGNCYFYECDYKRGEESIDWRVEINTQHQSKWRLIDASRCDEWADSVRGYMLRMGLHYGRLDFIFHGERLFFLECNSNGQFGWLDSADEMKLHNEFVDAVINPDTTINFYKNIQKNYV